MSIDSGFSSFEKSKFVVIPVPHEKTTSYGKGTKNGPKAILSAFQEVESFDEELLVEVDKKVGIHLFKSSNVQSLPSNVSRILKTKKIPIVLGGEHSITPFAVKAVRDFYPKLSVLQLDAHADLRDSYGGSKLSHACAMRRVLEICPAVQVGIRNLSKEEHDFTKKTGQLAKIHFAQKLEMVDKIENQLSEDVYITIDVDVFDPSVMPSTGTPEPGGLFWYEALDILREVCRAKRVVGFDLVELSPIKGLHAPDFAVAKLLYKLVGYISQK